MSNLVLKFDQSSIGSLERTVTSGLEQLRNDAVISTGKVVTQHAKQGGFKDHTRQLRSTITNKTLGMLGRYFTAEVRAPKHYASFVEKGTDPHDIPKPARPPGKPLSFWWEKMGVQFVGYGVHHPGTKPIPFMAPAFDYGRTYIQTFVRRGFAGIAARVGH